MVLYNIRFKIAQKGGMKGGEPTLLSGKNPPSSFDGIAYFGRNFFFSNVCIFHFIIVGQPCVNHHKI